MKQAPFDQLDIVLASASPRRRQLMEGMDLSFTVVNNAVEENRPDSLKREEIALYLSAHKARAFDADRIHENTLVVCADTIVLLGDEVLEKPAAAGEAMEMLQKLSGRMHEVITAVTLRDIHTTQSFFDLTRVFFRALTDDEIRGYVETYKPFDKAGAYGVQEWIGHVGIERIEGSYNNVMGLPTTMLYEFMLEFVGKRNG